MPYLFFTALAILFLSIYNKYRSLNTITFAGLFTILAIFTRYLGIALILLGIIIIILNNKKLKDTLIHLVHFSIMPIFLTVLWLFKANITYYLFSGQSNDFIKYPLNMQKLPLDLNMFKFLEFLEKLFYIDYKLIILIMILLIFLSIIYMRLINQLFIFAKDTIPITGYIIIYSIMVIVATSSSLVSINGVPLLIRYVIPLNPYIPLIIIALLIYTYDRITNESYKVMFKAVSFILLICLVAQGANLLYSTANGIRMQSIHDYSDRAEFNRYTSEYNITYNDSIYIDGKIPNWPNIQMALHFKYPAYPHFTLINNAIPGETVLDNITTLGWTGGPHTSLAELIKKNKNHSIYIIASLEVSQNYMEQPPKDICLINPVKFSESFICRVDLKNNRTCNINPFPRDYIIDSSASIKAALAGNFIGQKHDQLLILKSNPSSTKENILQILDFAKGSPVRVEYDDRPGTAWINATHSLLSGDFMGLGYDQAFHINGDKIVIEDFSQGKASAIIRYSEVLANNSALKNLAYAEDTQFAGDFLGREYSQVLFIDRNPKGGRLVIADFSKGKAAEMTEISEIDGNSTLLSSLLGDKDKQFSGDFMGLGQSQLLMINCNHTGAKEPKMIIADFSKEKASASVRYQENWGESSRFGGWLDANDTQLVGDFMGLGHSQVLFVNHDLKGGKINIVDFSEGKLAGKFWESWDDLDNGTIFQGWLGINDTGIVGDFKERGYSQVLFLNNSINGSNVTIVEFIDGKSMIST